MKHKLIRKHTNEEFDCLNEIHDFIYLKESNMKDAGLGVFASHDIPKNIILIWYKGSRVEKAIRTNYAWNFICDITRRPVKIEALISYEGNPLAFVNSFINEDQKKLLNIKKIVINGTLYYKTIKKILKDQELIVDYESKMLSL